MSRFTKGQSIWYYVPGMAEPLKYVLVTEENEIGRVRVEDPNDSEEPGAFELFSFGCYPCLEDALVPQVEWETERIKDLDQEIRECTRERNRLLSRAGVL